MRWGVFRPSVRILALADPETSKRTLADPETSKRTLADPETSKRTLVDPETSTRILADLGNLEAERPVRRVGRVGTVERFRWAARCAGILAAGFALAAGATPDALAAPATPDALAAGATPDALAAPATPDALAAHALRAAAPGAAAAPTAPAPYAPLNEPGPPLTVPRAALKASLYCKPSVRDAAAEPVLLNPATGVTAEENYSWNWEPALDKLHIPWCAYTAPYSTLGDIQISGEYLVHAIRTMYVLAHRRIAIMGHSQGGMSMRWALRFWPDTRAMVEDVIGFSGSNHGTTVFQPAVLCTGGCPPADWQQGHESSFIRALNSYAETFPGISYTEIYTHTDEVVQPNSGPDASAALHTGGGQITNVATQELCPGDLYEHLTVGTVDPVAYALALDALTHPGPANPERIPRSVCSQVFMPGVNPLDAGTLIQVFKAAPTLASVAVGALAPATSGVQNVSAEPPLACYVFATCHGADAPTLRIAYRLPRVRPTTVLVHVDVLEGYQLKPVPGATVRLAGLARGTNAAGNAIFTVSSLRGRRYRITATRAGCNPAAKAIRL